MNPWLPLIGFGVWQAVVGLNQVSDRNQKYAAARAYADSVGKPMLMVGGPYGAATLGRIFHMKAHGCGDVCLDIDPRACTGCQTVVADVRDIPFPDKYFGAAFCVPDLSFTKIATTAGIKWPSEVRVGDDLLTIAVEKGTVETTKVQAVFKREVESYIKVNFAEYVNRSTCLCLTDEHPVFTNRGWVLAGQLKKGDQLWHVPEAEIVSHLRRFNNPMKRPELRQMASIRLKNDWANSARLAELRARGILRRRGKLTVEERKYFSARMRRLNADPAFREKVIIAAAMRHRANRKGKEIRCKMCGHIRYVPPSQVETALYCSCSCMRADPEYATKLLERLYVRPTKVEAFVMRAITHATLPIEYVGNGKFWVGARATGIRNPDFLVTGQRKVVEAYVPGFFNRGRQYETEAKEFGNYPLTTSKFCAILKLRK